MAKVQGKKNWLVTERQALLERLERDKRERFGMDNIAEVCSKIKDRLDSIRDSLEAKRYILTALVTRIVIEGKRIRIRGGIPTAFAQREQPAIAIIASTSSGCCGRKTAYEFELVAAIPGETRLP